MLRRFAALLDPLSHTKRYAAELMSGTALDGFEFTLNLITGGTGQQRLHAAVPLHRDDRPDRDRTRRTRL
jgi:hypothetical protein